MSELERCSIYSPLAGAQSVESRETSLSHSSFTNRRTFLATMLSASAAGLAGADLFAQEGVDNVSGRSLEARTGTVRLLDGSSLRGEIVSISSTSLELRTSADDVSKLPLGQVRRVRFVGRSTKPATEGYEVTLHDGSVIHPTVARIEAGRAVFEGVAPQPLTVPMRQISSLRMKRAASSGDDWEHAVQSADGGEDLLVTRKSGALDQIEATVRGLDRAGVAISFDGKPRTIAWTSVEGVIFARDPEIKRPAPFAEIVIGGNRISIASLTMGPGDSPKVRAICGATIPLAEAAFELDFTCARCVALWSLDPKVMKWKAGPAPKAPLDFGKIIAGPQAPHEIGRIRVGAGTEERALKIDSEVELRYTLLGRYRHFEAILVPLTEPDGEVHLPIRIFSNAKLLWSGGETGMAAEISVDLTDAKSLTVEVPAGRGIALLRPALTLAR